MLARNVIMRINQLNIDGEKELKENVNRILEETVEQKENYYVIKKEPTIHLS